MFELIKRLKSQSAQEEKPIELPFFQWPGLKELFSWRILKGLRSRLLGFLALSLIIPPLVIGTLVIVTVRNATTQASLREQKEVASRIGDRVAGYVDNVKKVLMTMDSQGRFAQISLQEQEVAIRELLRNYPDLMECSVLNQAGRETIKVMRKNNKIFLSEKLVNRSFREEFGQALQGEFYIGPVFFTSRERIPQMFVSVSLGKDKGVLLARLSLDNIWRMICEVTIAQTGYAYVVNPKGTLIAHPDRERVLSHENRESVPIVQKFLEHRNNASINHLIFKAQDGAMILSVYHYIRNLNWGVIIEVPLEEILKNTKSLQRHVAAMAIVFSVVFLVMGLFLVRKILQPFGVFHEGVHRIGKGDFSQRVNINTGDEIQTLAEEVNGMAQSLETLEQTKRDLMHMIVHDLKSPLSSVLGSVDYVLHMAKDTLSPEQKKLLTLGLKSGKDLLRMIQNLLDLAKMEEGKLDTRKENFSLLELAAQCVDDLEASILRENKMISVEVPKNLPKAWADRDLIHRVLANLLTNALKHTTKGAEISIQADLSQDAHALLLIVRDNGEGIPKEFQEKIFDKFGQAEAKKQNFRVGTGLGLTFCRLAVEAHEGRIWVESEEGIGSAFFVQLPLPQSA